MTDDFLLRQSLLLIALLMFVFLLLATVVGYFIGRKHGKQASAAEKRERTVGTITGAMLALLGFMLAISLSMADSNFQARRKLVLNEANAISTSSLRAGAIGGPRGAEIVQRSSVCSETIPGYAWTSLQREVTRNTSNLFIPRPPLYRCAYGTIHLLFPRLHLPRSAPYFWLP